MGPLELAYRQDVLTGCEPYGSHWEHHSAVFARHCFKKHYFNHCKHFREENDLKKGIDSTYETCLRD